MQIIPISGSSMEGQGKFLTNIQSSGCTDSAVGYAGWGYIIGFDVRNMEVQNGGSGSNLTAVAFDLPGLQASYFENVRGVADGMGLRIGGLLTPQCDCYNTFFNSDFRANSFLAGSYGVDLEGYAQSNSFFGGSYWGKVGIGNGGWGNFFYGPDFETPLGATTTPVTTQSALPTGGNGLQVFGGYQEGGGLSVITSGSTGNYWTGQFTMGVVDNSGEGCLNFYSQPGSYASDGLNPLCLGVQDRYQFGSGTNGYNNNYYDQGDRGGTVGIETWFDAAMNRNGYFGHANRLMGFLNAKGITTNGSVSINALGTPPAPTLTVVGTAHTAACPTYYVVGIDRNGNKTLPSTGGTLSGNVCPNTLSGTNYIEPVPTLDGVYKWDVLKGTTATSIFTNHLCGGAAGSGADCPDTGQATTAYSAPASDATGSLSVASLTAGKCVQTSTGGLLTVTAGACGSGGGSSFPVTTSVHVSSGGTITVDSGGALTGASGSTVSFDNLTLTSATLPIMGIVERANRVTPLSGSDYIDTDSTLHGIGWSNNGGPFALGEQVIAYGSGQDLGVTLVTHNTCNTITVAATNAAATDRITYTPNASIKAVTGYAPAGTLTIVAYPTAGYVNFDVCNKDQTNDVTPGHVYLNWAVVR
jgi:hypothetical protein